MFHKDPVCYGLQLHVQLEQDALVFGNGLDWTVHTRNTVSSGSTFLDDHVHSYEICVSGAHAQANTVRYFYLTAQVYT